MILKSHKEIAGAKTHMGQDAQDDDDDDQTFLQSHPSYHP
jgi:hypothetical protein